MFKKKQKKSEKNIKQEEIMHRVETEADVLPQKESKTRAELGQRFQSNSEIIAPSRLKLKCKELQKMFVKVKNILEEQLDNLLIGEPIWQTYDVIMQSHLFRVNSKTKQEVTEDLGKIIQALELLYSKLHNNEKVKDILYVKDQSQLLLFFKHLFGKPYTLCNLPNFRKVLNTIWQHQIFESFDPKKMADHLRQWCVGIEYPLNPASIPLHRLVFSNPSMIKKYALLLCNLVSYCHIDNGDCMGLTPLLVATHANKSAAYEHIVKSGANLFRCPLTLIKNLKKQTVKKSTKQQIQILYPITQRHQFNAFEILLFHKQFQQIVNILSLNQVYKLKKLKKSNAELNASLKQIPDCCLQIHWKTCKGFLSFKQLPKDIITVYKKNGSLRIDFHVDDIQHTSSEAKHFSILIRTGSEETAQPKLQYYYLDHSKKKIYNFMREIHAQKLKLRYQQITQLGNIEEQYISQIKSVSKTTDTQQTMDINADYCFENIFKAPTYQFKDLDSYQRALFQSDTIDYKLLEASETKCSFQQQIGELPKVKSKQIKQSTSLKIEWMKEKINLKHLCFILSILDKKSPFFLKIMRVFDIFMNESAYKGKYNNKLPYKISVDLGSDFSIQAEIKNLTYMTLDDAVFGLEYRTKTMAYEQENVGLESLQQTLIMSQNYSINMSRFLGKTQKLIEAEEEQANRKFEEMLSREISGDLSDEDETGMNQKKQEVANRIKSERIRRPFDQHEF